MMPSPWADVPPLLCVAGMERSGTTWLARLLADCFGVPSLSRGPEVDGPEFAAHDTVMQGLERPGRPVRRGHWHAGRYPYPDSPVICITRDPRDQAVSSAKYYDYGLEPHTKWLIGASPATSEWVVWHRRWLAKDAPFVRYCDLRADPVRETARLIREAGLPLPPESQIRDVVRYNDFETMDRAGRRHRLMRRGVVGSYRDEMPPELAEYVVRICGAMMRELGWNVE